MATEAYSLPLTTSFISENFYSWGVGWGKGGGAGGPFPSAGTAGIQGEKNRGFEPCPFFNLHKASVHSQPYTIFVFQKVLRDYLK